MVKERSACSAIGSTHDAPPGDRAQKLIAKYSVHHGANDGSYVLPTDDLECSLPRGVMRLGWLARSSCIAMDAAAEAQWHAA